MPILLPALGAAAVSALGNAGSILPSRAERENRRRIREMEAKSLGLTPKERAALEAQYAGQLEGAQRQAETQARAYGAAAAQGSGAAALRAGQAATDTSWRAGREIAADLASAEMSRKAEKEQELQARKDLQAQYRAARTAALADVASAGLGAGIQKASEKDMTTQRVRVAPNDALKKRVSGMNPTQWAKARAKLVEGGTGEEELAALDALRTTASPQVTPSPASEAGMTRTVREAGQPPPPDDFGSITRGVGEDDYGQPVVPAPAQPPAATRPPRGPGMLRTIRDSVKPPPPTANQITRRQAIAMSDSEWDTARAALAARGVTEDMLSEIDRLRGPRAATGVQ